MPPVVPTRRSGRQSAPSSPLALVSVPYRHGDLLAAGGDYPDEWDRLIPIRPICEMLGIDPATQTDKLRKGPWTNRWASPAVAADGNRGASPSVAADGRRRRMACLPLRELPVWLGGISARRVAPGVREILWALQLEVVPLLLQHFLSRVTPPAAPAASPALPPGSNTQALPASPLEQLQARERAAIEDELFYIRMQAGRVEAHAGLGPAAQYTLGELFARVERLEGRLGLELRLSKGRQESSSGVEGRGEPPAEPAARLVDPVLVELRAHVRGLQQLLERLQVAVGVESGNEIPCLAVAPPRTTAMTELSRVRAFLLECTAPLKNDKKSTRSSTSNGATLAVLAAAYGSWAERRGIPALGVQSFAHQLARLDTPRRLYRRRFYYALEVRAVSA